jgi:hypothetical protein
MPERQARATHDARTVVGICVPTIREAAVRAFVGEWAPLWVNDRRTTCGCFFVDDSTQQPHIHGHDVEEQEVEDVMARPMEDRAGRDGSRVALGQSESGRYLRVIYVIPIQCLAPSL